MGKLMFKSVRLIAMVCALACFFTACGGEKGDEGEVTTNIDPNQLTEIMNDDENFGKSLSMYDDIKGTKLTLCFFDEVQGVDRKALDAFKKEYDIEVEEKIYNWNEWGTRIFQMVSSGLSPDNVYVADGTFLAYMARNVIQPIDDWFDTSDAVWNKDSADFFSYKGKHYVLTPSNTNNTYFIYYNKDLFESLDVEDPRTLYENGEWNYEKLREIAKKFVSDTDGDGAQDRYGFHCWQPDIFALANGGRGLEVDADGKLTATITNKNEQTGYQMYQDMMCVDKSIPKNMSDAQTYFANSKLAMISERPWNAMGNFKMYERCDFEIGVVPFPTGPDVEDGIIYAPSTLSGMGIAAGAKNPKAAVAFYYYKTKWINENYKDQAYLNEVGNTYNNFENLKWHMDYINNPEVTIIASNIYGLPSWWQKRAPFWKDVQSGVPIATCTQTHINLVNEGIQTIEDLMNKK